MARPLKRPQVSYRWLTWRQRHPGTEPTCTAATCTAAETQGLMGRNRGPSLAVPLQRAALSLLLMRLLCA